MKWLSAMPNWLCFLVVLIGSLIVHGCQTRAGLEDYLATWKGRPVQDWIDERGSPNWVQDTPAPGEKLYAWQFGYKAANSRRYETCTVRFLVDASVIKDFSLEGEHCYFRDPPPPPGRPSLSSR
jgi:hypothetical protein